MFHGRVDGHNCPVHHHPVLDELFEFFSVAFCLLRICRWRLIFSIFLWSTRFDFVWNDAIMDMGHKFHFNLGSIPMPLVKKTKTIIWHSKLWSKGSPQSVTSPKVSKTIKVYWIWTWNWSQPKNIYWTLFSSSTKWLLCSVKVYERDETVATICSSDSPNITLGNLLFVYSWAYSGIFVAKQTNRTH